MDNGDVRSPNERLWVDLNYCFAASSDEILKCPQAKVDDSCVHSDGRFDNASSNDFRLYTFSSSLTSEALYFVAAGLVVTWRTVERDEIKASTIRFVHRFVIRTMVWMGTGVKRERQSVNWNFRVFHEDEHSKDWIIKHTNLMFSYELLLDAGDFDDFGWSSRKSADTENDSDFFVCGDEWCEG